MAIDGAAMTNLQCERARGQLEELRDARTSRRANRSERAERIDEAAVERRAAIERMRAAREEKERWTIGFTVVFGPIIGTLIGGLAGDSATADNAKDAAKLEKRAGALDLERTVLERQQRKTDGAARDAEAELDQAQRLAREIRSATTQG